MQLFLISKSKKKSQSFTFGPVTLCVCMIISVVAGLLVFHAGSLYALNLTRGSFKALYSQTAPIWSQEIEVQQQMLNQAQENAEKNLDALAARLSKLQAHVMRLDALGSRLADMADFNEIEFDVVDGEGYTQGVGISYTFDFDNSKEFAEKVGLKKTEKEKLLTKKQRDSIKKDKKLLRKRYKKNN